MIEFSYLQFIITQNISGIYKRILFNVDTETTQRIKTSDIGDTLPTYYGAIICIFARACRPGSPYMNNAINQYVLALTDVWIKAFGHGHVITRKTIANRLNKAAKSYYNQVYLAFHRKSEKHKQTELRNVKPIRHLNKEWKGMFVMKDKGVTYGDLFDIGKKYGFSGWG